VPTPTLNDSAIDQAFELARQRYAEVGVDANVAIDRALQIPISLHCWQADDIKGFELLPDVTDGGGIMATGNHPGAARSADELRADMDKVISLLPGVQRLNLHACYAESGGKAVDRDGLEPEHFNRWMQWAAAAGVALDFNPTFFAHPKAASGMTLAHADDAIRAFWVRHGIAARRVGEAFGRQQNSPCITNIWIPDGIKDHPADRWGPRQRLTDALDQILSPELGIDPNHNFDSVESKLFGLGSEDYVVGSFEYYSHYALSRKVIPCLDMGHFHPTETIHDKISALLQFHPKLLLHVSRPIRWDSDHVVIFNDDVKQVFLEIARGDAFDRVVIALDYFDASINRLGAYVIGTRATRKAILYALLDPTPRLQQLETAGHGAHKLGLMDEMKTLPFGAVWDRLCQKAGVPVGAAWIEPIEEYERAVLSRRA
jgi:L-rhamnose isomerase